MIQATTSDKLTYKYFLYKSILHIIPVIDLLDGSVIHAKQGNRKQYAPIASSLTMSTKPTDIVKAFMDIYPFDTLYIADLNAIQSSGNMHSTNRHWIDNIHDNFPELILWVDAGINTTQQAIGWASPYTQLILGSESFSTLAQYLSLSAMFGGAFHLSLDFVAEGYIGPKTLLSGSQYWPNKVICMTLANVGTHQGINRQIILQMLEKAKNHTIYAAGGVRDITDLQQLKTLGVKGALVASALHAKQIGHTDLERLLEG